VHEHRYNEIAGRRLRRRRRDHLLVALRLTAAVLTAALAAELLWALFCSPRLRVRQVELVGVRKLDSRVIASRASIPPGAGIAAVSTRKIRRRLEAIPAVESATVSRDWPDTLVVVIRERTPAAFVRHPTGIVFLDRQGVAFAGGRWHTDGLPELKGVAVNLGRLGRAQRSGALKAALAALAAAQEAELAVGQVLVHALNDLELRLADETSLRLGRPEQLRLKLSQAKVALMQLQPLHEVEYLDVSCPDAAIWKPRLEL